MSKIEELYKNLLGSGRVSENEIGSKDKFLSSIKDNETAVAFYKNLLNSGKFTDREIGTPEDFWSSISSDFNKPASLSNSAPKSESTGYDMSGLTGSIAGKFGVKEDKQAKVPLEPDYDAKKEDLTVGEQIKLLQKVNPNISIPEIPKQDNPLKVKGFNQIATERYNEYEADPTNRLKANINNFIKNPEKYKTENNEDYSNARLTPDMIRYLNESSGADNPYRDFNMMMPGYSEDSREDSKRFEEGRAKLENQLKDFATNTEPGRQAIKQYEYFVNKADKDLDPLISEVDKLIEKNGRRVINERTGIHDYEGIELPASISDPNSAMLDRALQTLKQSKKLIDAYKNGNGFWKGVNPSKEDITEFLTFSEGLRDWQLNSVIDKQQRGEKLTEEETIALQAKAIGDMIAGNVDAGMGYNIGASTKQSASFMRDFMLTGGLGGAASGVLKAGIRKAMPNVVKGAAGLLAKELPNAARIGTKIVDGAIDMSARPLAQTLISPSSYSMGFKEAQGQGDIDENGNVSFNDRKDFSLSSGLKENHTEMLGEVVLGGLSKRLGLGSMFSKSSMAGKISSITGVQGLFPELAEEKYGDFIDVMNGDMTWKDFFDSRRNIETLGSVAVMQIPFAGINATGYAIGKGESAYEKRQVRKTFDSSLSNLTDSFGGLPEKDVQMLNRAVDQGSSDNDISKNVSKILGRNDITESQKTAVADYVTAYSAYSGMQKAKQENLDDAVNSITEQIKFVGNPDMGSMYTDPYTGEQKMFGGKILSVMVKGSSRPIQVTGGVLETNEDGSINREKSGDTLYYIDEDGSRKMLSIDDVTSVVGMMDMQEMIDAAVQEYEASLDAEEEIDVPDETEEPIQRGESVIVNTDSGEVSGTVVGIGEGGFLVRHEVDDDDRQGEVVDLFPFERVFRPETPKDVLSESDDLKGNEPINDGTTPEEQSNLSENTPNIEEIVKNAPKRKDGNIAYNKLMEQDPDGFAVLWEKRAGVEGTQKRMQLVSDNIQADIDAKQKKLEKETDFDKIADIEDEINVLTERKAKIDEVIQSRYAVRSNTTSEQDGQSGAGSEKGITLTSEQAEVLLSTMEENAETAPVLELTPENWYAEFGENGEVETPVGTVKMGENQYLKLQAKGRDEQFGMVKPTLTNPDVVIEEYNPKEGAERDTQLLFIKTFTDGNNKKYTHFESVTVSQDKKEVVVSSHILREKQLLDRLKAGKVVYKATSLDAPGQTSLEYSSQTESGALSTDKDTANVSEKQENEEISEPKASEQPIVETETRPDSDVIPTAETTEVQSVQAGKAKYRPVLSYDDFVQEYLRLYAGKNSMTLEDIKGNGELYDKTVTDAENAYPKYIDRLQKSGDLQRMYDSASPKEKKRIRQSIEESGREVKDVIDTRVNRVRAQSVSEAGLEEVNDRFNEELDNFKAGNQKGLLHLGKPLSILKASGINAKELTLSPSVLNKHLKKHNLTTDDLKGLAEAIQSPMFVYEHGETNPNIVIVTEMETNGKKLSVAVKLDNNGNVVEVNNIASVHGKDAALELERLSTAANNEKGFSPKWVSDKENVLNWLGIASLNGGSQTDNSKHLSLAKIIQNFENPKLPEEKLQNSPNPFTPISKRAFGKLIALLKKTGLAKDVVTDVKKMRKALDDALVSRMQSLSLKEQQLKIVTENNPAPNDVNTWIRSLNDILTAQEAFGNTLNDESEFFEDSMYPDFTAEDMRRALDSGEITLYSSKPIEDGVFVTPSRMNAEDYAGEGEIYSKTVKLTDVAWIDESEGQYTPLRFMATKAGEVYGFVTKEGTIYIDPAKLNANTPIHEFGHLWNSFIRENNADLYNRGVELIKQSPYWKKVNENPAYSNLSEESKIDEAMAWAIGDKGEEMFHAGDIGGLARMRVWLSDLWDWIRDRVGLTDFSAQEIEDLTLDGFTSGAVKDLTSGKSLKGERYEGKDFSKQSDIQYADQSKYDFDVKGITEANAQEMKSIKDAAISDGTFMKAPNGKESNLNEREWLQVRTNAFKKWFGEWEKILRIDKLRDSKPVEITGKEITPSEDLKQYAKNALKYGLDNLRGNYKNKDTGKEITVSRSSIEEVLHHNITEDGHIQSIAAIPQIIENSIYIDTETNTDKSKNPDVASYDYYVTGLKIDGVDYTVKAVIANGTNGERYYDHRLTQIEKTKLLSTLPNVNKSGEESSSDFDHKDNRLFSVLQINQQEISKVVDENGEPMVVYHGSKNDFTVFDIKKGGKSNTVAGIGFWFTPIKKFAKNFADNSWWGSKEKSEVYPTFINVRNPKTYQTTNHKEEANLLYEELREITIEKKQNKQNLSLLFPEWEAIESHDIASRGDFEKRPEGLEYYENRSKNSKKAIELGRELYKLDEKEKEIKRKRAELIHSDSYEKLRTDIYKVAGQTAEDANIGGLGMSLDNPRETVDEFVKQLKEDGNDGIIVYKTKFDSEEAGGENDQYTAFDSNQIKSATDNNGNFDDESDDIRYHKILNDSLINKNIKRLSNTNLYDTVMRKIDKNDFDRYLIDEVGYTEDELIDARLYEDSIDGYLDNRFGIAIEDGMFVANGYITNKAKSIIGEEYIKMYHHTSDAISNEIKKHGIVSGLSDVNRNGNESEGVYLTTRRVGEDISWYQKNAINKFGGEIMTLEVAVKLDEISPDLNDSDIESGMYQYVIESVSPDRIVGAKNMLWNDIRFQFIGEKGAFNLDKAEEATTRLDNLSVAREMEKQFTDGKEANTTKEQKNAIKMATGWERGADDKWRYELPDVEWNEGWYDIVENGGIKRLSDVVENNELFDSYPELNNVAVMLDDIKGALGSYSNKVITLDKKSVGKENMLSVISHEIQHAIQDIEGFARGGNISSESLIPKLVARRIELNKQLKELAKSGKYKSKEYKTLEKERDSIIEQEWKIDPINNPELAHKTYERLSGEVEARNTSNRMYMTPDERRASLASETEDVAREDQIFIYDSLGENNSETDKKTENSDTKKRQTDVSLSDIINEKGEVNYDKLRTTADAIEKGDAHLDRLSLEEEQGRRKGGRRNVEASILLSANERSDSTQVQDAGIGSARSEGRGDRQRTGERVSEHTLPAHQEELLKLYARKEGIWIEPETIEGWDYHDTGMEARVYKDPQNPEYFLKVVYNYKNFSETPLEYLDNRISLHNYLFSDSGTEYELIGFTETHGANKNVPGRFFAPVLRQKRVQGRELKKGELPLLDAEMKKLGFEKIGKSYVNGNYIIDDLHADNVMITPKGNFAFIDTVPQLNTPEDDFGGEREYGNGNIVSEKGSTNLDTTSDYANNGLSDDLGSKQLFDADTEISAPEYDGGSIEDYAVRMQVVNSIDTVYRSMVDRRVKEEAAATAFIDQYRPLKILQDVVEEKIGKKLESHENAWKYTRYLKGKNMAEIDRFNAERMRPLYDAMGAIIDGGMSEGYVLEYIKVKSGEKRNARMLAKKEAEAETALDPNTDYSGIYPILDRNGYDLTVEGVRKFIDDTESRINPLSVDGLWRSIKRATDFTLKKGYDSGLISKEVYEKLANEEDAFYVPLRGWIEGDMSDIYDYNQDGAKAAFQDVMRKAEGRKSEAENPIVYIKMLGESEILRANKNDYKQRVLNMARNHKDKGLYSVNRVYEVLTKDPDSGEDVWTEVNYRPKKEDFDSGMARVHKEEAKFEKRVLPFQEKDHQVVVYENGDKYVITLPENSEVAKSINGNLLNNAEKKQYKNDILAKMARYNALINTQLAPEFFLYTNAARDIQLAYLANRFEHGGKFANRFMKNLNAARYAMWTNGEGNHISNDSRIFYNEFINNGGETGYFSLKDFDKNAKDIQRELDGKKSFIEKVEILKTPLEKLGRTTEGMTRLSTYMTARMSGMGIEDSIIAAKDVTVNFEVRGSGQTVELRQLPGMLTLGIGKLPVIGSIPMSGRMFQGWYSFFNATIQGDNKLYGLAKENKGKMAMVAAGLTLAGMGMATFSRFLGGDDDDDEKMSNYDKLSEYVRRNNLVIAYGHNKFFTLPLPQGLRVFYGMGEITASALSGNLHNEYAPLEILSSFSDDISPLSAHAVVLSEGGGFADLVPSGAVPLVETVIDNKDFMGRPIAKHTPFNELDPEYTRVYDRTSGLFVGLEKALNRIGGGDDHTRGFFEDLYIDKKLNHALTNPGKLQHLVEGYTGGLGRTVTKSEASVENAVNKYIRGNDDVEFDMRDVPIVGKAFVSGSDKAAAANYSNRFFNYLDRADVYNRRFKAYDEDGDIGKLVKLTANGADSKFEEFAAYKKEIDVVRQELREYKVDLKRATTDAERKEAKGYIIESTKELNGYMRDAVLLFEEMERTKK